MQRSAPEAALAQVRDFNRIGLRMTRIAISNGAKVRQTAHRDCRNLRMGLQRARATYAYTISIRSAHPPASAGPISRI